MQHGHGLIVIHIAGAITTAGVAARIGGRPVTLSLPSTQVEVPAGRHLVEVEGRQGFVTTFGETRMEVDVSPGCESHVHYALPRTTLSEGRIGPLPQQRSFSPHWGNIAIGLGGGLLLFVLIGAAGAVWELIQ